MKKRPTLRDIAVSCGVSRTLVSVVLNGKEGKISCSESCRQKIRKTAQQMGYTPNCLAQSMSSGCSPVVAVMLHLNVNDLFSGSYDYFNELFPRLTLELNARGLEVLFVPCRTKEEQILRLDKLLSGGLVGAVISNIFPDSYREFTRKLADSCVPYTILGYPYGEDSYCIYSERSYSWLDEILLKHPEWKNCQILTRVQDKYILCRYPFEHNYIWLAEKAEPSAELLGDPGTLIVCAGLELYQKYAGTIRNPLLLERARMKDLIPENVMCHLAVPNSIKTQIAQKAAQQVADWLLEGKEPELKQICIKDKKEDSK